MKAEDWASIKHFSIGENWGDVSVISIDLVKELDSFRDAIGIPMVITCGTQGAHVPNSQHYKGLAADCVFDIPDGKSIWDVWKQAFKFKFRGIGVYPYWRLNGKVVGGLHLDVRQSGHIAQWIGHIDSSGKQVYLPISKENLLVAGFTGEI